METAFDRALAKLLPVEGGFSNHIRDRGGRTRFGITEQLARAYGYTGPMDQLPIDLASRIYREHFWNWMMLGRVSMLSERLAHEMFDTGVNMGRAIPIRFLQRTLNVMNRRAADWQDIAVDGGMGEITLSALRLMFARRGLNAETVLLRAMNTLQGARYVDIAEGDADQEEFVFGWFLNRVT